MSTRYNNGSHYENHPQAAELHNGAEHAYRVAEQQGKQGHLSGHEHSRQALEQSSKAGRHTQAGATVGHGIPAFGHDQIASLAYEHWQARGCPHGSPQQDWFYAAEDLRSHASALSPGGQLTDISGPAADAPSVRKEEHPQC
jgi:Protein of unknown function (DUF2934)